MSAPAYSLKNLTYRYQGETALHGLNIDIPAGQRTALLGANGSGKSTLLRLLAGLYFSAEGSIQALGHTLDAAALSDDRFNHAFRQQVGMVFQNPDVQLFNPTVEDEIAFGPLQLGWPVSRIEAQLDAMLQRFDLIRLRSRAPHRLSGGEKKRVALASVLILEPDVLLLDEPTAALDPKSESDMLDFLMNSRGNGKTIITATHQIDVVAAIADHVIVLEHGTLAAQGLPAEILKDTALLRRTRLARDFWHAHDDRVHAHLQDTLHSHTDSSTYWRRVR